MITRLHESHACRLDLRSPTPDYGQASRLSIVSGVRLMPSRALPDYGTYFALGDGAAVLGFLSLVRSAPQADSTAAPYRCWAAWAEVPRMSPIRCQDMPVLLAVVTASRTCCSPLPPIPAARGS